MNLKIKIFANTCIVILIFLGLIFLNFRVLLGKIKKLSRSVEQQQLIIKNPDFQQKYQEQINQLKTDYEEIEPKLSLLNQSLLSREKAVDFIQILEQAASANNLKQELRALPETKNNLNFSLDLIGSFPQFLRFLEYIENIPYLLQTSKVTIKALETGQIQASLEINAYVQ